MWPPDENNRFTWAHSNNGPDQIAQQESADVWGIFEAKGGSSQLGVTKQYGSQMSGRWIDYWIKALVKENDTDASDELESAFQSHDQMLASVTRLRISNAKKSSSTSVHTPSGALEVEFRIAAQVYKMGMRTSLRKWDADWLKSGWKL